MAKMVGAGAVIFDKVEQELHKNARAQRPEFQST
jgi:hypothetical protein